MKFSVFLPFLSMKSSKLFDNSLQVFRGGLLLLVVKRNTIQELCALPIK